MSTNFNPACRDLAWDFLGDDEDESVINDLAHFIQYQIEEWIDELIRDRRETSPESSPLNEGASE